MTMRALVAFALAITLGACTGAPATVSSSASPMAGTAPIASALPDATGAGAAVPGAQPAETSAPITMPPPATPTPTPDPAVWRFEGVVVDATGRPLDDVCVAIGPKGCQRFSPHTDTRGVYFVDVPQNPTVIYDLTFVKDGFAAVFHRAQPSGPTIFNVMLRPVGG